MLLNKKTEVQKYNSKEGSLKEIFHTQRRQTVFSNKREKHVKPRDKKK